MHSTDLEQNAKTQASVGRPMQVRKKSALGKFVRRLLPVSIKERLALEVSSRSFQAARERCKSVRQYCEMTYSWTGEGPYIDGIVSFQHIGEEIKFFELVAERRPHTAIEIGTCNGGTLFVLMATGADDLHAISIDLPGGIHGGGYKDNHTPFFRRNFPVGRQRLDLIRADSGAPSTLEQAKRLLDGQKLDYLYIDGDHRYEGVRRDFLTYAPLVKPGGLIAFHDVAAHTPRETVDVPRFWSEIKSLSPSIEIVIPPSGEIPFNGGFGVFTDWDPGVLDVVNRGDVAH